MIKKREKKGLMSKETGAWIIAAVLIALAIYVIYLFMKSGFSAVDYFRKLIGWG
jgi:hypothetical protein